MNRDENNLLLRGLFGPQQPQPAAAGQQQPPDNVEVEDDQDDEDEDDDDDEDDDGIDRDADGVLDGGVAGGNNGADDSSTAAPRRRSADCDLILFITCAESMEDLAPNHPILKEGVVVSIGLDKNTKLSAVFRRYSEFCNEHISSNNINNAVYKITESDLEFYHCQLLNGNDTAESSALMKNDRIKVRRERADERAKQTEYKRIQRESDREYFKHLRQLVPDPGAGTKYCDLIMDCQGTLKDYENGRNQQVLSTIVRGSAVVLGKRCKWLGSLIETAREERAKRMEANTAGPRINQVVNEGIDDDKDEKHGDSPQSHGVVDFPERNIVANTSSTLPDDNDEAQRRSRNNSNNGRGNMDDFEEEDDDAIGVLAYPVQQNRQAPQEGLNRGVATEIEDDNDDDADGGDGNRSGDGSVGPADNIRRSQSPITSNNADNNVSHHDDQLWVTLPNHSPEAVKLLLEYCYTNRVISLGHDAFTQACRTKPAKSNGPIPPFSSARRWPENGLPQVSFSVALAGISLAEEAGMHRFSLMCEIAAAQLVSGANVVEALSMCTSQKTLTGNPLPRLREIAISIILRAGPRGVFNMPVFRRALEERTTSIIPTLLSGTVDAINNCNEKTLMLKADDPTARLSGQKRQYSAFAESYFDELDREDAYKRERERRKRRLERYGTTPKLAPGILVNQDEDTNDVYCDSVLSSSWAAESARRSLKRMSHHLNSGTFNVGRSGVYAPSRETFGSRVQHHGMTKRSSRRRSNERN